MIKFLSIPGIFSAIALIIIMLPQSAGDWVSDVQLKSLINELHTIKLYCTFENRFSFMDAAFCFNVCSIRWNRIYVFYATRSYGLHYILLHFNRMVNRYWRIYIWTINGETQTMASY